MRMIWRMLTAFALLVLTTSVWAWGSTGHYVIAAIAYKHLNPAAKKQVNRVSKTFSYSRNAEYRFMVMSAWPDRIKLQGVESYNQWHFMAYPYTQDSVTGKRYSRKSLMWAIRFNEYQWLNDRSPRRRAKALAFIVHLVGDAHQPMHCVTLYNKRFTRGDKGGLSYRITSHAGNNLHAFWDNGGGLLRLKKSNYRQYLSRVRKLAKQLQQQYPWQQLKPQIVQQNPKVWTRGSYELAVADAYDTPYGKRVSKAYVKKTKQVSRRQLVLAGYRLAYWLNHHVGNKQ